MNADRDMSAEQLLEFADPYALYALDEREIREVVAALESASGATRSGFEARVHEVRETMAAQAAGYPETPPPGTFDRILGRLVTGSGSPSAHRKATRSRRTLQIVAAAAVVIVSVAAGVVAGRYLGPDDGTPGTPSPEVVLAAPDARTAQARVGDATISLIYSRRYNSGVVLMNDVPPPRDGTVYQMWLMDPGGGARSRGTMGQKDVRPTTTAAVSAIDGATSFGISIEAPGGARAPSARIVATLPIAAS